MKVMSSLSETFRRNPRIGWGRADAVAGPEALAEIASLSKERRILQEELERVNRLVDSNRISPKMKYTYEKLSDVTMSSLIPETQREYVTDDISILALFMRTCQTFSLGVSPKDAITGLSPHITSRTIGGVQITINLDRILEILATHDLIKVDSTIRSTSDGRTFSEKMYTLSEYGKDFVRIVELQAHSGSAIS